MSLATGACFTTQPTVDSNVSFDGATEALAPDAGSESGGGDDGPRDEAPPGLDAAPGSDAAPEAAADATVDDGAEAEAQAEAAADDGPDASPEAETEAAVDAQDEVPPDIDAGADCLSPASAPPLSAAAEGLPTTGLLLWLRADRGVYMTTQNAVCAWRDQSGNDVLVSPSSVRPTWTSAGLGGQPAIHFDAVGSDMGTSGVLGLDPASARTFIAVTELVVPGGRFHPILQGQGGSAATYLGIDENTWATAGSLEGAYITGSSFDTALATGTLPRVHVLTVSTLTSGGAVTSAVDYRVNGVTQTLSLRAGSGTIQDFTAADFTTIGDVSGTPYNGVYGDAFLAEAIVYDRALSAGESAALETALEARYGIP